MAERPSPHPRSDYVYFRAITTRWMDNDVYGHVNNVQYYSYFDTVVNGYLIERGVLDPAVSPVIGLVVETHCNFFSSLTFPESVDAGLRVARIGDRSVHYEIALFSAASGHAAAQGHFIHAYVDRTTRRPTHLPGPLREALRSLLRKN